MGQHGLEKRVATCSPVRQVLYESVQEVPSPSFQHGFLSGMVLDGVDGQF